MRLFRQTQRTLLAFLWAIDLTKRLLAMSRFWRQEALPLLRRVPVCFLRPVRFWKIRLLLRRARNLSILVRDLGFPYKAWDWVKSI